MSDAKFDAKYYYLRYLAQVAAESYLKVKDAAGNVVLLGGVDLDNALRLGANRKDSGLGSNGHTQLTDQQIAEFLSTYQLIDQWADNPTAIGNSFTAPLKLANGTIVPSNTGFSATLMAVKDKPGEYVFSIRSTEISGWESGGDKSRDGVGADFFGITTGGGYAWAQIDAMRYYVQWLRENNILPSGAKVHVTGFSLGGHLALAFEQLYGAGQGGFTLVDGTTFNGAGLGGKSAGSGLTEMSNYYRSQLASPTWLPDLDIDDPDNKMLATQYKNAKAAASAGAKLPEVNIYEDARHAWAQAAAKKKFDTKWVAGGVFYPSLGASPGYESSVVKGLYGKELAGNMNMTATSGYHPATIGIPVESQPLLEGGLGSDGDYTNGHSITLVGDSLALIRALQKLDPTLSLESYEKFGKWASNKRTDNLAGADYEFDVLENLLDALRRLLQGDSIVSTKVVPGGKPVSQGFSDPEARAEYYKNINELASLEKFATLEKKVKFVDPQSVPDSKKAWVEFIELERTDFSAFLTLYTLSPYQIKAVDGAANVALESALNSGWKDIYTKWKADQNLSPSEQTFSNQWLEDRQQLLFALLRANALNKDALLAEVPGVSAGLLADAKIKRTVTISGGNGSEIRFGDDKANVITASEISKSELYGQDGNDTLTGGQFADYLEGGDGDDSLVGGKGLDTLRGGGGGDKLFGGDNADLLHGGKGKDELDGDAGDDALFGGAGSDILRGGADNDFLFDVGDAEQNSLRGGSGSDYLEVKGGTGASILDGGIGNDQLLGSKEANNILSGGKGNDSIAGGDDMDIIDGDGNADGEGGGLPDGADLIEAGGGADIITGGGGADLLRGGSGDDTYKFDLANFGTDTIEDWQGSNVLQFGATPLTTAAYNAEKRAWVAGNGLEIRKLESGGRVTLAISNPLDAKSTLYLRNWAPGDHGLTLTGAPAAPAKPATTPRTQTARPENNNVDFMRGEDGDAMDGGAGNDILRGTDENSLLLGGSGHDLLDGRDGDDWIDGGDDADLILTGKGKDVVYGGAGGDLVRVGYKFDMYRDRVDYQDTDPAKIFYNEGAAIGEWLWTGDVDTSTQFYYYVSDNENPTNPNRTQYTIPHPELANFDISFKAQLGKESSPPSYLWWMTSVGATVPSLEPSVDVTMTLGYKMWVWRDIELKQSLKPDPAQLGQPKEFKLSLSNGKWILPAGTNAAGAQVWGGAGDDVIYGANDNDKLQGDTGNDLLVGYDGNDELAGGDGKDSLSGGDGRDLLDGGIDADQLIGGLGADVIYGGTGDDQLVGDAPYQLETKDYPKALNRNAMGGDFLDGGAGKDTLWGDHGDDLLYGGTENDLVFGGEGDDRAFGDQGDDTLWGNAGGDHLDGGLGKDVLLGGDGGDLLQGGSGEDKLEGGADDDRLDGGDDKDLLVGGAGSDQLRGDLGDDVLQGDAGGSADGADILEGGAGNDQLVGGGGSDRYVFNIGDGKDVITDDGAGGARNMLLFKFSADEGRVKLQSSGKDLLVTYGSTDSILVKGYYVSKAFGLGFEGVSADDSDRGEAQRPIESIVFEDGTVWTTEDILAMAPPPEEPPATEDPYANLAPLYFINSLLSREETQAAGKHTLSFSFSNVPTPGATGAALFTAEQQQAVREALACYSDVLNLSFTEVASGTASDLTFYLDDLASAEKSAYSGYAEPSTGAIHFNSTLYSEQLLDEFGQLVTRGSLSKGSAGFPIILHEVGHALGLKHPFEGPTLPAREDNWDNTLMSYTGGTRMPTELAAFDVAALQSLYGVAGSRNAGDNRYGLSDRFIADSGGVDTVDASAETQDVTIQLAPGSWNYRGAKSTSILADGQSFIGLTTQIEHAVGGSGNDTLSGSDGANSLRGGAGTDTLSGLKGSDTLEGGAGADTYFFALGDGADTVVDSGADSKLVFDKGVSLASLDYVDGQLRYGALGDAITVSINEIASVAMDEGTLSGDVLRQMLVGDVTLAEGDVNGQLLGSANRNLTGNALDNLLTGNAGRNLIVGGAGKDTLKGAAGDDSLQGGGGDDTLDGGAGNDQLYGGSATEAGGGNDTYLFGRGSGQDTLFESLTDADQDRVRFVGLTEADVDFSSRGSDLVIQVKGSDEQLTIAGYFASAEARTVESLEFEGGLVLDKAAVSTRLTTNFIGTAGDDTLTGSALADRIEGAAGNDSLSGQLGDDTLIGGAGNDTLEGGAGNDLLYGGNSTDNGGGNDLYLFGRGSGQDTIFESLTEADQDRIRLVGVSERDVAFQNVGGDLLISIEGTDDRLRVVGYFSSGSARTVETIQFGSGTVLDKTAVSRRLPILLNGTAGNDTLKGTSGNERISGADGNDDLSGNDGNDTLIGGAGNDFVMGNGGADTYVFRRGDGQDVLFDSPDYLDGGNADRLQFGPGIALSDLVLTAVADLPSDNPDFKNTDGLNSTALLVQLRDSTDRLLVRDFFTDTGFIEEFAFADGTVCTGAQLLELVKKPVGTDGSEAVRGGAGADLVRGLGGDDVLRGLGGDDTLEGGDGNDKLLGDQGNDSLLGGAGKDTLIGGAGNDRLEGGDGLDQLNGGDGDDLLISRGDDDRLSGGQGNDTLDSGIGGLSTGNATFYGDQGSDTFILRAGMGRIYLTVNEDDPTAVDVIQMPDFKLDDVLITQNGSSLIITSKANPKDVATIAGPWKNGSTSTMVLDSIKFADGTELTTDQLIRLSLTGTPNSDRLKGSDLGDTMDGGGGYDLLYGQDGDDLIRGGTGNDSLYGMRGSDTLEGGEGDDELYGTGEGISVGDGSNLLVGGAGNDKNVGGLGNDTYVFGRGDGYDSIEDTQGGSDVLKFGVGVLPTDVQLVRDGNDLVAVIDGSSTQARIKGFYGVANRPVESMVFSNGVSWDLAKIESLAISGTVNSLTGTAGDDVFVVDNASDTITEAANAGIDEVRSSVTYTLPNNVENFTATGLLNLVIQGNDGDNVLRGNVGNNVFRGSKGNDQVFGGLGDDTYYIEQGTKGLVITELADEGMDTLLQLDGDWGWSWCDVTLPANVERLIMGASSTTWSNGFKEDIPRYGTGNVLDNYISGDRAAANYLDGLQGRDTLVGGSCSDVFAVDREDDVVVDGYANEKGDVNTAVRLFRDAEIVFGTGDLVVSTAARYTLSANIENLFLKGISPANGTGNSLANVIVGNDAVNRIDGGGGDDKLYDNAYRTNDWGNPASPDAYASDSDTLLGGEGNDQLTAFNGNDSLEGGAGDDVLTARAGRTVFVGGLDNDLLQGGGQGATYRYARGDGNDTIDCTTFVGGNGKDALEFGPGINAADVTLEQTGTNNADLLLRVAGGGSVLVKSYFKVTEADANYRGNALDSIRFADGTAWKPNAVLIKLGLPHDVEGTEGNDVLLGDAGVNEIHAYGGDDQISGDAGNDRLYGDAGTDTISGGTGNDLLAGGAGSDVYRFSRGDGVDVIQELALVAEANTLEFGPGIRPADIVFTRADSRTPSYAEPRGNSLVLSIKGSTDQVVIENYFAREDWSNANLPLTTIRFTADGNTWTPAQFASLARWKVGSAGNDTLSTGTDGGLLEGLAGNDSLKGSDYADTLFGGAGNDTLDGGRGADSLVGGDGDDTYLNPEDQALIVEGVDGGFDTLVGRNDLRGLANVEGLVANPVAWLIYGNELGNRITGNADDNKIYGGAGNDTLDGGSGGLDELRGEAGDDTYLIKDTAKNALVSEQANEGVDTIINQDLSSVNYEISLGANIENYRWEVGAAHNINGNELDNQITGGGGADSLFGGAGNDTLIGNGGNDSLQGDAGNDSLVGGDGRDSLYGGVGNDTLDGGTGDDFLVGGEGTDVYLWGRGSGSDEISGSVSDLTDCVKLTGGLLEADLLVGASGASGLDLRLSVRGTSEVLTVTNFFAAGSQMTLAMADGLVLDVAAVRAKLSFEGTAGDDFIAGTAAADRLDGKGGQDTLQGGAGQDTYVIHSGLETINDPDSDSIILLASDLPPGMGYRTSSAARVELMEGSLATISIDGSNPVTLVGNADGNQMSGGAGNDTLVGNGGNDTLTGGAGYDTYRVRLDDGLTIVNESQGLGDGGELKLSAAAPGTSVQLWVSSVDGSLNIEQNGELRVKVGGFQVGNDLAQRPINSITLPDGTVLTGDLLSGAAFGRSGNGNDELMGSAHDEVLWGLGGSDTLHGGGRDWLVGGDGADRYVIDGTTLQSLYIEDNWADAGSASSIKLEGMQATDVRVANMYGLLVVYRSTDGAEILLSGWNDANPTGAINSLQSLTFADGTVWTQAQLLSKMDMTVVSSGVDYWQGGAGADVVDLMAGNDYAAGGGGDDSLAGGDGNDLMQGGDGADTLLGGEGNDSLQGEAGDDLLIGGLGNDEFTEAGHGNDVFDGGEGDDTLYASNFGQEKSVVLAWTGEGQDAISGDVHGYVDAGAGDDTVSTTSQRPLFLVAGKGNDDLSIGSDVVIAAFNRGDGQDRFSDAGSYDPVQDAETKIRVLSLGGGIRLSDIQLSFPEGDGCVIDLGSGDLIQLVRSPARCAPTRLQLIEQGVVRVFDLTAVAAAYDVWRSNGGEANGPFDARAQLLAHEQVLSANTAYGGQMAVDYATGRLHTPADAASLLPFFDRADRLLVPEAYAGTGVNGTANADLLTGTAEADVMNGLAGNDTLDGGLGADTMAGGAGDDRFLVDNTGDVVVEQPGEGFDTVRASVSYVLPDEVEVLELQGTASINGKGNAGSNRVVGNPGANLLDGGAGADTLIGGLGNDVYVVDDAADVVTENAGEGTDTVQAWISRGLDTDVENLSLMGTADLAGTGNALNNVLTGNAGANRLDGGAGVDVLQGGAGNDTYVVDSTTDTLTELAGEGQDAVESTVSYTLGANLEKLTLMGVAAINGTGNELANTLNGNAGNNLLDGGTGADTMAGGAGDDTYTVDNAGDVVSEGTSAGNDLVKTSLSLTLAANVERLLLTGSANLNGTGNALGNTLTGNAGANTLDGGAGSDTLIGGAGDDIYVVDVLGDQITENLNEGTDTVQASLTWTLGTNLENLTLLGNAGNAGTGNELNNVITGNSGSNKLTGNAGNDTLDGGAGADTLLGGAGDDVYYVDAGTDVVTENTAEGTDTIFTSIGRNLDMNVENLTLTGTGNGNLTGNGLGNVLTGNAGVNRIEGGAGLDTLVGGAGDDTYVVDTATDTITELVGGGTDTVESSVSQTLSANVEKLVLTSTGSTTGTGNDLANTLTGNSGANILDGGTGADTLIGGAGDDVYIVDQAGDVVTEKAAEGTDTVKSSVTITALAAEVEKLVLTGSANLNGTGNALANTLTGNAGANILDGGAGLDTMTGGAGDDTYLVDTLGEVVTELLGEGTDTVRASLSWVLSSNVENLVLLGTAGNTATGNTLNNVLTGNSGANRFDGGAGIDTLIGGAGDDVYVVDTATDVITELANEGTDTVEASVSVTLAANVEKLVLTSTGSTSGTGNDLANTLTGNAGNNTLDGGLGADNLIGGAGDDTYIVDNVGDVVTELAAGGNDTLKASVSIASLAAEVERLVLTGTSNLNGTGNALANALTGNAGANILDGGAGLDTMTGGAGDDTYLVDVSGEVVTELAGEGTDTVKSAVSWSLAANLENLTLLGTAGNTATGNSIANVLTGNAGANALVGLDGNDTLDGGAGADTLTGGTGADTYVFGKGAGTDLIVENDSTAGVKDVVSLGVTKSELKFTRSGNNLVASINGTTDSLTLQDWYLGTQYQVEEFRFSNAEVLTNAQVQALVVAMAGFGGAASLGVLGEPLRQQHPVQLAAAAL